MGKVVKMSAKEFADEILWDEDVHPFAMEKNGDNEEDDTLNYDYWYFVKPVFAGGMMFLVFGYYGDYAGEKLKVYSAEERSVESIVEDYLRNVGFANMEVYYDMEDE